MLVAALAGVAWILHRPPNIWGYVFSILFLIAMSWIVISVLWPAHADRTCPECGSEKLERLDPSTTIGIRCSGCGFVDDSKSSWLLAEEEGPLENLVLEQRRARRRARARLADGNSPPPNARS